MTQILILGGYGMTGSLLARLLLEHTDAVVTIAGRSLTKAETLKTELAQTFSPGRIRALAVDVEDIGSVRAALDGIDLVVLATSYASHCAPVAIAALECNVDYLDLLYGPAKLKTLVRLTGEIEKRGLCFISEAGFHPGLPLALARYLGAQFDRMEEVHFGCAIRMKIDPHMQMPESISEVVAAFSQRPLVYGDGRWMMPWLAWLWPYRRIAFAPPFRAFHCIPLFLQELALIPVECPDVKETAFYMAGFNWFVDWILSPVIILSVLVAQKAAIAPMGKLLFWGMKRFARPPYGTQLVADAQGMKENSQWSASVTLQHDDAYFLTAAPVVALLKQYLDGGIRRPGLWMMGQIADPARLIRQMSEMGIRVETQKNLRS